MKIAKLTQDSYRNYGNILQNYALQEFLRRYADTVDTLWHTPRERIDEYWKWNLKKTVKFIINRLDFRSNIRSDHRTWEWLRDMRFYDFNLEYIRYRYDLTALEDAAQEYDYFVVGSDQVWKPTSSRLDAAFLKFAPPEKRVSFSASMGVVTIPKAQENYFRKGFQEMKAISVREESAAELIERLTGRKVTTLMDPCFYVSAEQWRGLSRKPYWMPERPFMFTYFLGRRPSEVDKIAKKLGLETVHIFDRNQFYHATVSPQEWLALLDCAALVYTDSFHCSVFSMLFRKPFVVCDRIASPYAQQMRTRFDTVLMRFHQESRFTDAKRGYEISEPFQIRYDGFDETLAREAAAADSFVRTAFEL